MYSPASRQETLEKIVSICKAVDDIEGVILVGSGSDQFPDKWADIDLSIVVNPASKTKGVWDKLNEKFKEFFELITLGLGIYGENNYISILLLKDFLEVDAGVISLDALEEKKEKWKILYEKQDSILKKMHQTHKNKPVANPVKLVRDRASVIGHYVRTFTVAINRNQPFRAMKELEDTRNIVVDMWAAQKRKVSKHFRDVDAADIRFRQRLASTFSPSLSLDELKMAFTNTVDLFFEIAEEVDRGNKEIIVVNKAMNQLLKTFNLEK